MDGKGVLSAEDMRAVVIEMLFALCGNARVEGLAKVTQRNIPPQLLSICCTSHPYWQEHSRGTRTP
jgi:hypothetical protein